MTKKTLFIAITLMISCNYIFAQNHLKGKVQDISTQEGLVGATIIIKGTSAGIISDANGDFSLPISPSTTFPITVICSYVGYETQEITLQDYQVLQVNLRVNSELLGEITVTARRRTEEVQEIPIAITVVGGKEIDNSIAFNVNRVKELVPSVQLYSSNPRNTTLNIRGLGSTFGLTNDGIDPGVGFYVDGVYYARPAATTLDFIDIQQIEVLRGPQGTLFGKNTTAGAFNITTKKPTFQTSVLLEQTFGNFDFIQTKGSVSGTVIKDKLAYRLSISSTQRAGTIYNTVTNRHTNTLNNQGARLQLLYLPNSKTSILLAADYTYQNPDGYAQVFAGVAPTLRPNYRQFESIIADLGYNLPSRNPFDRTIDHDTPWKSEQKMGGVSLNVDIEMGRGTLTTTSAWRTWHWNPSNDRDFTGLQALARSQAPSIHNQWSQEIRYASDWNSQIKSLFGVFAFYQQLEADGAHTEESGKDQWRFIQNTTSLLWQTPSLLDGYGIRTRPSFSNFSGAIFGQLDWKVNHWFSLIAGGRLNYDQKRVDFQRQTFGGLQTNNTTLIALQQRVYNNQSFNADTENWNFSGQLSAQFLLSDKARLFATYSLAFKPIGLNLGGLPTDNSGRVMTELAVIAPERVNHYEIGFKTTPWRNAILNFTLFNTDVFNYQTNVQSAELGVNRGYLANAEQVRVWGAEIEKSYTFPRYLKFNFSLSYTEGNYVKFTNAPVPLEETGGENFKDISGEPLPGISNWAFTSGIELYKKVALLKQQGEFFLGLDGFYRSGFSSSPSRSAYLNVEGYALFNARIGFRVERGFSLLLWSRNLSNVDYFEQLLPAAGNVGHFAGVLGDPRTYGITLRYNFQAK